MRLGGLRSSGNIEDRRGLGGMFRGGGGFGGHRGGLPIGGGRLGIGGLLLLLILSYVTGINPLALLNTDGQTYYDEAPRRTTSAGTPNDETGRFIAQVLGSTEDVWSDLFQKQYGSAYRAPRLVLFTGMTPSACGTAQSAAGPFYCPNDRRIYLDTAFFSQMRARFDACPAGQGACAFAQAYVIAHEVAHHVQSALGVIAKVNQLRETGSRTEANALSVKLELQADCLAGVWAHHANKTSAIIETGDVEAALQTARAIGDDMLQRRSQGTVVPDSFTHGSSEQRQRWLRVGLEKGSVAACNTFGARAL